MALLTPTRRAGASLRCEAGLLYDILTDYDTYVEWMPGISESKALALEGDLAIAEFHLAGGKKDRWVVECIHTRNKMVLWRTIEGKIPITQVEWTIEPGGEASSRVSLAVTRRLEWGGLFSASGKFLEPGKCLKALEVQVSSFMPEIAVEGVDGEKILELTETEDGVICIIRGKKYVLKQEGQ